MLKSQKYIIPGKTRNFSAYIVARIGREEGYIEHKKFDIGDLFIGELFVIDEYRTLTFLDSETIMDGQIKEKIIDKLKIN